MVPASGCGPMKGMTGLTTPRWAAAAAPPLSAERLLASAPPPAWWLRWRECEAAICAQEVLRGMSRNLRDDEAGESGEGDAGCSYQKAQQKSCNDAGGGLSKDARQSAGAWPNQN